MIKIDEKYYIDADTKSYTLKEKMEKVDEEGKIWFKDLGYYTTLGDLTIGLIRKETRRYIKESNDGNLEDLIKKIEELEKYFKDRLGKV